MRILVTGSSSHLARALLPPLLADARVHSVAGIDVAAPHTRHPKLTSVRLDVRAPQLAGHLRGVDAVVHLAFVVMQGDIPRRNDGAVMRSINVEGSRNVFTLVAGLGVRRLIHLSSASVYTLPAPADRIGETHARGGISGFAYAAHKVAAEDALDALEREYPALEVVRLRPHVILGPHAQPFLRALLRARVYPALPPPLPLTQCVHEADVVDAIVRALFADARGAFNLACDDAASFRVIQKRNGRFAVPVPPAVLRGAFGVGWNLLRLGTEPGWVEGLRHSLVLDSTRARAVLGWRPRFATVASCLAALD